jgi:F420-dependent oxidoreductase-like protein
MQVGIMVEGQNGLNWARWERIVQAVEELGFAALHRSDHFTNTESPDLDSLELWVSLTWLASHTERIQFGPLVTPLSFRHPVFAARMAKDVDNLSGGRLILGLGAGWQDREHTNFGFDLLEIPERFDRFEEGLEVISSLLRATEPVDFRGDFYRLREAVLLPRPHQPGSPSLLIGGNGRRRTLPLAARFADEWNGVFLTPQRFAELSSRLDELLRENGRRPRNVRRSLMTGLIFGANETQLRSKLDGRNAQDLRDRGMVVGSPAEVVDQLGQLAEVGVERILLQWLALDDLDGLETLAQAVLQIK